MYGILQIAKKAFFNKLFEANLIKNKKKILSIDIDKVEITLSQKLRRGFNDYQSSTLIDQ